MGIYRDCAPQYYAKGLTPLPIRLGTKAPIVAGWQQERPDEAGFKQWLDKYGNCGLGLGLGMEIKQGLYILAIDVDAEDMVPRVEKAIGAACPVKIGKKGKTFFLLSDAEHLESKKIKTAGSGNKPGIEFLGPRTQTLIPPTIHPDTGQPYRWIGKPLLEWEIDEIPRLTTSRRSELEAHTSGSGAHFDSLNEMVCGHCTKTGGNSHDVCVAAAGSMVAKKWTDAEITERLRRAKKEACERGGGRYHWPEEGRAIAEWIKSARDKGMADSSRKVPMERLMATWALSKLGGPDLVRTEKGVLRHYQDGHWPEVKKDEIRNMVLNQEPSLRNRESKDAVDILCAITDVGDRFGKNNQKLCLQNGTLDIKTGELGTWDPGHEIRHQLPFEWDAGAECSLYEDTVALVFGGDAQSIAVWDEFCALTLVDDMSFQKMLFLRGSGANGKSTLAQVLRSMHDPDAVASVAITELDNERKRSSLLGKLVNISTEQSRLNNISDAYLKKITGGDPVDIRFLYKEVRNNVRLSVRFLELVNEMPATADSTEAFQRRLMILTCPYVFPKEMRVPDFHIQLIRERPGILKRWVAALRTLYQRQRFDEPDSSNTAIAEYVLENDPVRRWMEARTERDKKGHPSADLYADFKAWEKSMGYQYTTSEPRWSQKLTTLGFPRMQIKLGGHYIQGRKLVIKKGMESPV